MMPVILSLGALLVAVASTVLAQVRIRNLERRLQAAIGEIDHRLAAATVESTDRVEAWVRSFLEDSKVAQRETAEDTLSQWSAQMVAEIDGLFASFRVTIRTESAAIVGQALVEYEGRQRRGNSSSS